MVLGSPAAETKLSKSNGILVNNQIISNTTFVTVNHSKVNSSGQPTQSSSNIEKDEDNTKCTLLFMTTS